MRKPIFYILVLLTTFSSTATGQELSEKLEKRKQEIYDQGRFHRINNNPDSSLYYADQFIEFAKKYEGDNEVITAYYHKLNKLNFFNRTAEGFSLALSTLEKYGKEPNKQNYDGIYNHLVKYMIVMQDYRGSLKYLDLLSINNRKHDYYYKKAELYCYLNLPDSALVFTTKYITDTKEEGSPLQHIHANNNQGLILKKLGRFPEAIQFFTTAIELAQASKLDQNKFGYLQGNLGSCYYALGKLDSAQYYLQLDAKQSLTDGEIGSYLSAAISLIEIAQEQKEFNRAIKLLDGIIQDYDHHLQPDQKLKVLKLYMESYKPIGNDSQYQSYLNKWVAFTEQHAQRVMKSNHTMMENYNKNALRLVTLQLETEKQLLNQQLISQERAKDKTQLKKWLIISGLFIIILIILFILFRYRKKIVLKDALLQLAQKEQAYLALKVQEENRNVQVLSHELTSKQDFSSNLVHQLSRLDNISKPELKSIELYIQNELDVKSTRGQLQQQMGELSSNFHTNIKLKHSNLSKSDITFAAMIAMNMTNKEIGISKNMTTETVKTTKYRLKKKLQLPSSVHMDDYLTGLLD